MTLARKPSPATRIAAQPALPGVCTVGRRGLPARPGGVVPVLAAVAFALLGAAGSSPLIAAGPAQEAAAEVPENPIEATEESVRAGLRVYGRFCRACHGIRADGQGMTAPPGSRPANLIDDEWVHGDTDGDIFLVIRNGVPPAYDMEAWEGRITDEEMWHIVNFLRNMAERMAGR